MNKNLFQLDKHGFEIINFSKELSQDEKIFLLEITDNEKKNISKSYENRFFDLIKWEYKDGAGLSIYQKIINHLKIKTKISTNYLDLKFTRLVYLTKDFENSDYANQIPHFDYIRTLNYRNSIFVRAIVLQNSFKIFSNQVSLIRSIAQTQKRIGFIPRKFSGINPQVYPMRQGE